MTNSVAHAGAFASDGPYVWKQNHALPDLSAESVGAPCANALGGAASGSRSLPAGWRPRLVMHATVHAEPGVLARAYLPDENE